MDALAEQVLPGQDALVRRQLAEGVEPSLQLSQGGISGWPHRRVRATGAVRLTAMLVAGKLIGISFLVLLADKVKCAPLNSRVKTPDVLMVSSMAGIGLTGEEL